MNSACLIYLHFGVIEVGFFFFYTCEDVAFGQRTEHRFLKKYISDTHRILTIEKKISLLEYSNINMKYVNETVTSQDEVYLCNKKKDAKLGKSSISCTLTNAEKN